MSSIPTIIRVDYAISILFMLAMGLLWTINFVFQPCVGRRLVINRWRSAVYLGNFWAFFCTFLQVASQTSLNSSNYVYFILLWTILLPTTIAGYFISKYFVRWNRRQQLKKLSALKQSEDSKYLLDLAQSMMRLSLLGNKKIFCN